MLRSLLPHLNDNQFRELCMFIADRLNERLTDQFNIFGMKTMFDLRDTVFFILSDSDLSEDQQISDLLSRCSDN